MSLSARHTGLAALLLAVAGCGASSETVQEGPDGPDGVGPEDVLGSWHTCSERLSLLPDGSFLRERLALGCLVDGTWSLDQGHLSMQVTAHDCDDDPQGFADALVVRSASRIVLFTGEDRSTAFWSEQTPRQRYRLTGTGATIPAGGTSVVRLIGDPTSGMSACYWSEDRACGGFLSCGGGIDVWSVTSDSFVGKLGCAGGCPCAAVLQGQAQASGQISGTFDGIDCNGAFEGSFLAAPVADVLP